ncbi:helix-turn-helix domain-containing protein [Actinomadura oligospora]|uniref:helix-turn-helix domain-containing protein n=1 Tax=Actinomadura oligospora TaxID=111804 RepID=UPI0004B5DD54|nr:helix-turn-helix transcriptional regulator [Actinomadura oligospora]
MSEEAKNTRKAFGIRLRGFRLDAGFSGRGLSEVTGIHNTKISRIEHGHLDPNEAEIRSWMTACGVARHIPEMIAIRREVLQMWQEHREALKAGLKHVQGEGDLYERTRLVRIYEASRLPGILQCSGYVHALMDLVSEVHDLSGGEDAEEAAETRLRRQGLLTRPNGKNTFSIVLEGSALQLAIADETVMTRQFDFLAEVTRLPHVSFGVIPAGAPRRIWAGEGFYIFDDRLVRSEMWTVEYRTDRPHEIAEYVRIFELLRASAVYGAAVRRQIELARARVAEK